MKKALELALDGNEIMLRIFLDRILPAKPKDEPINFIVPELNGDNPESLLALSLNILKMASAGEATPMDCRNIAALIAAHHKNIGLEKEIHELIKNVNELKKHLFVNSKQYNYENTQRNEEDHVLASA